MHRADASKSFWQTQPRAGSSSTPSKSSASWAFWFEMGEDRRSVVSLEPSGAPLL